MASKKYSKTASKVNSAGEASTVIIEQPKTYTVVLEITGTAPLLQNSFSQKALEQMLRKHMGLSTQREAKKPRECIEAATIRNTDDRVCIPTTAIKKAMLSATGQMKSSIPKTKLRQLVFVAGGSVPITFDAMVPQMDMVRTSGINRVPDVRFRPRFEGWKGRLAIEFSDTVPVQTIVDLVNRAGKVGVGEWRPEKDGTYGTFTVSRNIVDPKEIAEVLDETSKKIRPLTIPSWALDADIDPELLRKIVDNDGEEAA